MDFDVHYRDGKDRLQRDRVSVTVGAISREVAIALASSEAAAATADRRTIPLARLDVRLASFCCRGDDRD